MSGGPVRRALALVALPAPLLALAPAAAGRPTCRTPPSPDRGSVPGNPHLADSPYPTARTNNFAQH